MTDVYVRAKSLGRFVHRVALDYYADLQMEYDLWGAPTQLKWQHQRVISGLCQVYSAQEVDPILEEAGLDRIILSLNRRSSPPLKKVLQYHWKLVQLEERLKVVLL